MVKLRIWEMYTLCMRDVNHHTHLYHVTRIIIPHILGPTSYMIECTTYHSILYKVATCQYV